MSTEPQNKTQLAEDIPSTTNETQEISGSILLMFGLMVANAIILRMRKLLRQKYPRVAKYIQESTLTTLLGLFTGMILKTAHATNMLGQIKEGYETLFMIVLLPPIIFESALNMDKKLFFNQIGSIMTFAVFGTLIATFVTGGFFAMANSLELTSNFGWNESLAFGALISATDPVSVLAIFKEMHADKLLCMLIFGESILNDAFTVTFFRITSDAYIEKKDFSFVMFSLDFCVIFFGSMAIGYLIGLICAKILKMYFKGDKEKSENQENTETIMMMVVPWISYLIGEGFDLSGIVTIMFCGISMSKYCLPNLSNSGKKLTKRIYDALATSSEHIVFIFIGISFFSFDFSFSQMGISLFFLAFLVINVARFFQIKVLSFILNFFRDSRKIDSNYQNVLIYSGFRGAMAFALAIMAKNVFKQGDVGQIMLLITLLYATVTIFVQGTFLVPVMEHFEVFAKDNDDEVYAEPKGLKKLMVRIDDFLSDKVIRDDVKFKLDENNDIRDDISDIGSVTHATIQSIELENQGESPQLKRGSIDRFAL